MVDLGKLRYKALQGSQNSVAIKSSGMQGLKALLPSGLRLKGINKTQKS